MKLKVTKSYVDRYTLVETEKGTILNDVPDKRAKELIGQGVAEEVKQEEAKKEPPKKSSKK